VTENWRTRAGGANGRPPLPSIGIGGGAAARKA
jgi:hypothetical protein